MSLSHSSIFMMKRSANWSVQLDMELTELNLRYKKNIGGLLELGIELPALSLNSGFLDNILAGYHDTFGFPDYGRNSRPGNVFLYEVRRNGNLIMKGKAGKVSIGDARLSAKKVISDEDPIVSIKAAIELPSGASSGGYGSGSIDAGLSILMDKKLGDKINTYYNLGIGFPGALKAYETVPLRNFLHAGAGIEAALWKNLALLGQVVICSSPFPETEIPEIDRTAVLLSLGGRYSSGSNSLEFSLTEDPGTSGAPDFTINISFRRKF